MGSWGWGLDDDMPRLRVDQPVDQLAVHDDAPAHAGAHGDIDQVVHILACAHLELGQRRRAHVGIDEGGHLEGLPQVGRKGTVLPARLGRGGDIAIGGRIRVQIQGTKPGDAQGFNVLVPKIRRDTRQRLIGRQRGHYRPVQDMALLVAYRAHHLGAARLQSA